MLVVSSMTIAIKMRQRHSTMGRVHHVINSVLRFLSSLFMCKGGGVKRGEGGVRSLTPFIMRTHTSMGKVLYVVDRVGILTSFVLVQEGWME